MNELILPSGTVPLPAFFPDATRGVVRTADSTDLVNAHVQGLVMNTYHPMTKPGPATIKSLGGLHRFAGWDRPIITDSGGFQVFSLIRENASFGEIRQNEIIFRRDGKKVNLSPTKCIQSQLSYGADVLMALDYCTHPGDPYEVQAKAIDTTIRWGKQCMDTFNQQVKKKTMPPQLFGIIQGGNGKALRKECAEALIQMGYTGFGFGGWPLDDENRLAEEILAYTAELIPNHMVKYAMGIGKPENIVACVKMGYNLFDCVIPTREARHNRLYVFNEEFETKTDIDLNRDFYRYLYPLDETYRRDGRPLSALCDCLACTMYSRAYLRHLLSIGDSLGSRLATIHNLRFFTMLMEILKP
ncbi:MAG: tRNA guanosine(34) transglycosylase Tgt [Defluviitaleaceae bacterium]|nr:tRNA guanosine(34) transglycosylase Tgt [Defluviitaleaceae bacterium]